MAHATSLNIKELPRPNQSGFTWKMGAEARQDIDQAALILSRTLVRGGYFAHANIEYGSIVTGGNVSFELRMATKKVRSISGRTNVLLAKDERTVLMWHHEIVKNGGLIVDDEFVDISRHKPALQKKNVDIINVPFNSLLNKNLLPEETHNSMMLGALVALICFDIKLLEKALADVYASQGKDVVKKHRLAARIGYAYVQKNHKQKYFCQPRPKAGKHFLMEGNEGMILGALKAGMTSYTGYAMTPISGILHQTALLKKRFNIFSYQPEDEISACLYAIGANLAGARAMTGTSGGGFALMSEAIGLAAMTETPLVLVMASRAGPSTGIATRHGQGDLRFVLHASQEQPPRIVLAPSDPEDAFELTFHAFNLAEKYQTLVIILTDKYLQESFWTQEPFKHSHLKIDRGKRINAAAAKKLKDYKRYKITSDGVSPLLTMGSPNIDTIWRTSSSEHDERGFTSENRKIRVAQMEKRHRKIKTAYREYIKKIKPVATYGPAKVKVAVVTFGSNKGVILDAIESLDAKSKIKLIVMRCLMPFPSDETEAAIKGAKKLLFVESNQDGQLEGLVREHMLATASDHFRFYDARPATYLQIAEFIKKHL